MQLTGNTIVVTGGGSGIGRGLAEAFHRLGNQVVVAGRGERQLAAVAAANPGMRYAALDQADPASVASFAAWVGRELPDVNVLVNNAGIQRAEDLKAGRVEDAEATVAINFLGPIRLTAALLPALLARPHAAVLNVSSALAFVPQAITPTYAATKAAIHAYTQALRFQLRDTAVQVLELIPPWVQTGLQGERGYDPRAMPLDAYLRETIELLAAAPDATEVVVERARAMRYAEREGRFDALFAQFNEGRAAEAGAGRAGVASGLPAGPSIA